VSWTWTDENFSFAVKLWGEGRSAAGIARELGGEVTRNAVIGKLNRMGFTDINRDKAGDPRVRPSRAKAPPRPRKPSPPRLLAKSPKPRTDYRIVQPKGVAMRDFEPIELVMPPPPPDEPLKLLALQSHHCKFPIGDPRSAGFTFCGEGRVVGRPYCVGHLQIAYTKRPAA
jgi:GcrA cell cycle regulator